MEALHFKTATFEEEVLKSEKPVLVDFWATWCGPCQMQGPIVEELAQERDDIKIGKVNVDEESDLAEKFGIMSIPTIIAFRDGEVVSKAVGVQTKDKLLDLLGL